MARAGGEELERLRPSRAELAELVRQRLESERSYGLRWVGLADPRAGRCRELERLRLEAESCVACPLSETRTKVVFATGNPKAELLLVGEAPGRDEDLRGEPFVGRAGELLDRMLAAMGLDRREVYIANIIKCRPPGNRTPNPLEVERCRHFIRQQIALVGPRALLALGAVAARELLETEASVGSLRGRWHDHAGIPLRVTYHPAYLLRNPAEKRKAWEDLKAVLERLGRPVPSRSPGG